jgi:hypothetical protein
MSGDPCDALFEAYLAAMQESQRASALSQRWASTEPLSRTVDVTPLTVAQGEEMARDFEHEERAHKEYVRAMEAFYECRKSHPAST